MSKRRQRFTAAWYRRCVQVGFLVLFLATLVAARPAAGRGGGSWRTLFFDLDPLILVTTFLAAHTVPAVLLLALVTIVITALFGRLFCGWFCPLGTVHAACSHVIHHRRRQPVEVWSRWQLSKYFVLAGVLVMAACGVQWLALLDPIALLYRSCATALLPATQAAVEDVSTGIYQSDPHVGTWRLTQVTEPAYQFLRETVFVTPQQTYLGSGLILAFLLLTVGLNFVRRRFWCRYLCPLGGLLGLIAWRPWVQRRTNAERCNACGVCGMHCHGAAGSSPGAGWKPQECLGCMNCNESCPKEGLRFSFVAPWQQRGVDETIDLSRRGLLGSAVAGLAGVAVLRVTPQARGSTFNPDLIRPPGARPEAEFLSRCIACGACMNVCPTGSLQPTLLEAGLAGIWTPRVVPRLGYCDYSCTRCGEVCPTQAIVPLALADKQQTRLGLATIDTARCIPYAFGRECIVCEEHCPIPEKAIYFEEVDVVTRAGERQTVKRPRVDPRRCIGCGICEHACPYKDRAAIRVTSTNETRHPANQSILAGE